MDRNILTRGWLAWLEMLRCNGKIFIEWTHHSSAGIHNGLTKPRTLAYVYADHSSIVHDQKMKQKTK